MQNPDEHSRPYGAVPGGILIVNLWGNFESDIGPGSSGLGHKCGVTSRIPYADFEHAERRKPQEAIIMRELQFSCT